MVFRVSGQKGRENGNRQPLCPIMTRAPQRRHLSVRQHPCDSPEVEKKCAFALRLVCEDIFLEAGLTAVVVDDSDRADALN